jgi:hypothetical protein
VNAHARGIVAEARRLTAQGGRQPAAFYARQAAEAAAASARSGCLMLAELQLEEARAHARRAAE